MVASRQLYPHLCHRSWRNSSTKRLIQAWQTCRYETSFKQTILQHLEGLHEYTGIRHSSSGGAETVKGLGATAAAICSTARFSCSKSAFDTLRSSSKEVSERTSCAQINLLAHTVGAAALERILNHLARPEASVCQCREHFRIGDAGALERPIHPRASTSKIKSWRIMHMYSCPKSLISLAAMHHCWYASSAASNSPGCCILWPSKCCVVMLLSCCTPSASGICPSFPSSMAHQTFAVNPAIRACSVSCAAIASGHCTSTTDLTEFCLSMPEFVGQHCVVPRFTEGGGDADSELDQAHGQVCWSREQRTPPTLPLTSRRSVQIATLARSKKRYRMC